MQGKFFSRLYGDIIYKVVHILGVKAFYFEKSVLYTVLCSLAVSMAISAGLLTNTCPRHSNRKSIPLVLLFDRFSSNRVLLVNLH